MHTFIQSVFSADTEGTPAPQYYILYDIMMLLWDVGGVPEAAGARPHGRDAAALVRPPDALGAEVLGQEVQLVGGGLEGQLVQLLL
jgi:hypothetical protein